VIRRLLRRWLMSGYPYSFYEEVKGRW